MRLVRSVCAVLVSTAALSGCTGGSSGDGATPRTSASSPSVGESGRTPVKEPLTHLSKATLRTLNKDGLTTTVVKESSPTRLSEDSVLGTGTKEQRDLVTEIDLVRMTNANAGPMDSDGVVRHPSMLNQLVWVVITRDPYPFVSGPIDRPHPVQTAPLENSYLWTAIDAETGKFVQAETFNGPGHT